MLIPVYTGEKSCIFLFFLLRWRQKVTHISLHHFYQLFTHRSWMVHTRTHVDLYNPRIQILINHKIIPNHLEKTSLPSNTPFTSLDTPYNNILNFLLNNSPFLLPNILTKSFHIPHSVIKHSCFMVLLDWVVSQMHKFVMNIVKTIIITTKSKVALFIEPDYRRIVVLNKHPLSYVKFFTIYQQRILYIFLDDKLTIFSKTIVCNVI